MLFFFYQRGRVMLEYYKIDEHLADILTKPLKWSRLDELKDKLNMKTFNEPELRGCVDQ